MPTYFAKNGTAITLPFGQVLDSTGAEYTSAVVADVKIAKNNGTLAALNGLATLVHKEVGFYELTLTTSDISAVGHATIVLSKTTYIAPPVSLIVLPATVYDALVTNPTNSAGGLIAATDAISAAAGYVGSTGAAVNGTTANTLASHDPGATLGTSTLTQTQVTGGAYALNHASFAFSTSLDFTTTQKAATLARVTLVDTTDTLTNTPAFNGPSAGTIADAVWDEALADHLTLGTFGYYASETHATGDLSYAIVSSGTHGNAALKTLIDDIPTVAEFEARTLVAASYGTAANQATIAGYLDTEVAAILAAVDTEVAAIKAKTDQLTFTVANQVDANALALPAMPTDWLSAAGLSTAAAQEIADAVLTRDVDQVEDIAPLDSLCWVVLASRYNARSVNTLTVNKTTGTVFGTRTLGTTVSATYIVSMS